MKIKYYHYRRVMGWPDEVFTRRWNRSLGLPQLAIDERLMPTGGETWAVAVSDDGSNYFAAANAMCSKKDNYCYKTGREIAKERLLKNLVDKGYDISNL